MEPTRVLRDEHEVILRALDVLDGMATLVEQGRPVEAKDVADATFFIRRYADGLHHHEEEELLFPAMVRAGFPRDDGPIGCMLQEHDQGRLLIRGAASSFESGDVSGFARQAREFTSLLRHHIVKENEILFRMAEETVQGELLAELRAAFEEALAESDAERREHVARLETLSTRYGR